MASCPAPGGMDVTKPIPRQEWNIFLSGANLNSRAAANVPHLVLSVTLAPERSLENTGTSESLLATHPFPSRSPTGPPWHSLVGQDADPAFPAEALHPILVLKRQQRPAPLGACPLHGGNLSCFFEGLVGLGLLYHVSARVLGQQLDVPRPPCPR